MSDLNAIAIFIQVVESCSFSQAARALQLPKATVSRKVAALEASLGVELLHRTTRKLYLTEAGTLYFERCRHALNELEEADRVVTALQVEPQGTLKITAPVIFGTTVLGAWIAEFLRRYDQVRVEVLLSNQSLDLAAEGIDVAFRWQSDLHQTSLEVQRSVKQVRYWVCASLDYIQQYGEPQSPQDLMQHCCIVMRSQLRLDHADWQFTDSNGAVETVAVKGTLVANDLMLAMQAAIAGAGIVYLPETLLIDAIAVGNLKRLLPTWGTKAKTLFVTCPNPLYLSSKVRVFLEFVAEKSLQ